MKKQKLLTGLLLALTLYQPVAEADNIDDSFNFNNTEVIGFSSISTTDDSTSMVINPGGVGLKGEGEIFFSNSISSDLSQTNLFGALGIFNLGYQQFLPAGNNLKPIRKYIVGTAYPFFDGINAGLTYSNVQSTDGTNLNASSFDIGILTRPLDFLSLGLVVRNINTPSFGNSIINRTYHASFGIRPGGWDRLSVTLDGGWVENSPLDRIRATVGLETEFIDGIVLKGRVSSDPKLSNITWSFDAGVNFPYIGLGYSRVMNTPKSRDSAYAKLSFNHSRTVFQASNARFAEIELKGNISANKENSFGFFSMQRSSSLYDYLENIDKAEKSKDIAGLILNMNNFSAGLSVNEELRNKIKNFKKSGKKVIAYIRSADLKDYYLASVADYVVMHPIGELQLLGLGTVNYYYRDLFDKVGIEAQFEKVGKYKSAPEPFTKSAPSAEEKEQTLALLKDLYQEISDNIVAERKISADNLKNFIQNRAIINSGDAKDLKLIDQIAHYDEIGKIAAKLDDKKGKYPVIDISKREYKKYNWADENQIAIINATGTIIEGSSTQDFFSNEKTMGADTISKMLEKARNEDSIKAVILRVDSGGGSALASDIIAREISRFKEAKKPVVISMANVAASGGYWLATDADKIVSNAGTITGSIGVFTGKINFSRLLKKLEVNTESIKIGEHADAFSQERPFTDEERKILFNSAQSLYRIFLERVAEGRKIPITEVEKLAQGRVYSGKTAKELKLIDEIGGLEKAIEVAKALTDIKDKKIEVFNFENDGNAISKLTTSPAQAFYPFVFFDLVKENSVLAIMPNLDLNF